MAGGVAGAADVDELRLLPDGFRYGLPVRCETVFGALVHQIQAGAGQQGSPFVDLVERVGGDHDLFGAGLYGRWLCAVPGYGRTVAGGVAL